MPINEDKSKISIDFAYESSDGNISFDIQYSYTEELGKTITIFNKDDSIGAQLPVGMFVDIVNFLIQKGIVEDFNSTLKGRNMSNPFVYNKNEEEDLDIINTKPIGSFSNSLSDTDIPSVGNNLENSDSMKMPVLNDKDNDNNSNNLNNKEQLNPEEILRERKKAAEKAKLVKITRKE